MDRKEQKQIFLNTYVNNVDMEEAVQRILHWIENKKQSYVVEINVDVVMKIEKDSYLKKISDEADLTLVDGMPLIWISKLYKNPIKMKVSGSDLIPSLLTEADKKGYSVFIFGGRDAVVKNAAKNVQRQYKNLKLAGFYAPPFGFEKDAKELQKIQIQIQEAKPDIVLACLGCPKQEKWVYENYKKIGANVTLCAGATVDFLAGNIKRAPKWMSNIGFEWFYRFLMEPRRLFKRYFIDDVKIIRLIWNYRRRSQ